MKSYFSAFHPTVNFLYFGLILTFSMTLSHPLCRLLSLLGAVIWSIHLLGMRALRFQLTMVLPMMVLAALINPAFSHEGATILTYLPTQNPLTLESIIYGISMAFLLASVMLWFSCYHEIMTSDKFLYLFGRLSPALSLILSMALRFVPRFKAQFHSVSHTQSCLGHGLASKNLLKRSKGAARILSVMVSWSLENAIETADSMKSRGYGVGRRTAFSIYRLEARDKWALLLLSILGALIIVAVLQGALSFRYYPVLQGAKLSIPSLLAFLIFALFCFVPLLIELWEDRKWNSTASNS